MMDQDARAQAPGKAYCFGRLLVEARMAVPWTRAALAERAGVPLDAVEAYERGYRSPSDAHLEALAGALSKRVDELRTWIQVEELDDGLIQRIVRYLDEELGTRFHDRV